MFTRIVVVLLSLLALVAGKAATKLFSEKQSHQRYMWKEFMRNYNKQYSSPAIEESRFGYFLANLKIADERNAREVQVGGNAVHGITKFFDQDAQEFRKYFLGSKKPDSASNATELGAWHVKQVNPNPNPNPNIVTLTPTITLTS